MRWFPFHEVPACSAHGLKSVLVFLSVDVTAYFFGVVPQSEFAKPGFSSVS
ncbi:hypothetical protein HMPREF0577_1634 [Mobiluncus mulieris ATCC 35243]|nr:hypothetical protein HMPREF0577_1634 [Mobiluncus mulieris ATCC 35243]